MNINLQNLAVYIAAAETIVLVLMGLEILEYHSVIRWITFSVDSGV